MLSLKVASKAINVSRCLATSVQFNSGNRTLKQSIEKGNPFWLDHQRTANEGFHKHINMGHNIQIGSLGLLVASQLMVGLNIGTGLLLPIDVALAAMIVHHSYHGVANMISDYIPLVAPPLVTPLKGLFLVFCVISFACWLDFSVNGDGMSRLIHRTLSM